VCGIGGIVHPEPGKAIDEIALRRMARALRHRGPEGFGLALEPDAGFVSTRLAIVDRAGGWQPIETRPDGDILVYNGEVYNHRELRAKLQSRGESFATTCDSEVVARLLVRVGLAGLECMNGQFAFAWWQPAARRLTLVRDRFGVRPLHYASLADGSIIFGSEAKALFASGEVTARPDLTGIDDVFTLWGPRPPRTAFSGVRQLLPGSFLVWQRGEILEERRWWSPTYGVDCAVRDLGDLLRDSVRLRLRADVPVGAYLSGGLDSSLITALARTEIGRQLQTFSIAFGDPRYDERSHQENVARILDTSHHVIEAGPEDIADAFATVIRHAETPMVRSAPVPLYLLAKHVRQYDVRVVLSGEGADELFWGYDLFKEVALRELHERDAARARDLVDTLYPYLSQRPGRRGSVWRRFLLEGANCADPLGSHLTRATATATVKAFYRPEVAAEVNRCPSLDRLRNELPDNFEQLTSLERAAWLEVATLLEPCLLAAQGDRVSMAHGVEGRFPFLDHRVFALAAALPAERKLDGLRDKVAVREVAHALLPPEIASRPKWPYRAPGVMPFFGAKTPGWVSDSLSRGALEETGIWDAGRVAALVRRCGAGQVTGIREEMALVGILSTQVWYAEFCRHSHRRDPIETAEPRVRIDRVSRADTTGAT
jgi:asparagine synthase (glutamine-hydrolysing)